MTAPDPTPPAPSEPAPSGPSLLERRYRGALRLLPAGYRAEREEEMVAAFLELYGEAPDEANPRPAWAELASVAALAVRVRLSWTPRAAAWGGALRLLAVLGLGLQAMVTVGVLAGLPAEQAEAVGPAGSGVLLVLFVAGLSWLPAFAALLQGYVRAAKALALTGLAAELAWIATPAWLGTLAIGGTPTEAPTATSAETSTATSAGTSAATSAGTSTAIPTAASAGTPGVTSADAAGGALATEGPGGVLAAEDPAGVGVADGLAGVGGLDWHAVLTGHLPALLIMAVPVLALLLGQHRGAPTGMLGRHRGATAAGRGWWPVGAVVVAGVLPLVLGATVLREPGTPPWIAVWGDLPGYAALLVVVAAVPALRRRSADAMLAVALLGVTALLGRGLSGLWAGQETAIAIQVITVTVLSVTLAAAGMRGLPAVPRENSGLARR
ncbi:hypothetical protein ACIBG7_06785 [Nonomuraea sp. NPDC050328]|uniref:hypothetical protein n=1 Tax=Nonomuraea sp. NPDC050328 TaxID=3364361 RepID=UPI003788D0F7